MTGLTILRMLNNISMAHLAEEFNINKQNVNAWENGSRPIPKKYIPTLCLAFNTTGEVLTRKVSEEVYNSKIQKVLIDILKNQ